jgi:hypothetical protein
VDKDSRRGGGRRGRGRRSRDGDKVRTTGGLSLSFLLLFLEQAGIILDR